MQLGFVSAILPDLSLAEVLRFAAETGYRCVEVMCWPVGKAERRYAGVTHLDVTELSPAKVAEVRRLCESTGVAISGLGYYPNPLSPDTGEAQVAIEQIGRVIDAAAELGVGRANTFVGRDWHKSIDDNWPRFLEVFHPLVEQAERRGVRLGIENCPMFFTRDEWPGGKNLAICPAVWRRMFADIPSPNFGLNFDPSHLVWQRMDYIRPLKEFAPRISHVHAKDVRILQEQLDEVGILATPLEYHRPKLPGLGEIDWAKFLAALAEAGYDGPVCVEVEDRDFEHSLESRQEALRRSFAHLQPLMPK